jgi:DNA-binding MarR family transcriptional regulator
MVTTETPAETLEADMQRMFRALFQHKHWQQIQRSAKVDIDRPGAAVLKAIANSSEQPVRPHAIANYLGIEAPSITRKVQQLEIEGYLVKEPDPKDGRAFNLKLTRKGQAQLAKLKKARQDYLDEIMKDWQPGERENFARLMHIFSEKVQNIHNDTEKES